MGRAGQVCRLLPPVRGGCAERPASPSGTAAGERRAETGCVVRELDLCSHWIVELNMDKFFSSHKKRRIIEEAVTNRVDQHG